MVVVVEVERRKSERKKKKKNSKRIERKNSSRLVDLGDVLLELLPLGRVGDGGVGRVRLF